MNREFSPPPAARGLSALAAGLMAAAATWYWWSHVSFWLGFSIALVGATVADMIWAARTFVPMPHIVLFIAALQYALAPWASNFYPSLYPEYQIPDLERYFRYIGPALAATALGFLASMAGMRFKPRVPNTDPPPPRLLLELDILLWGGLAVDYLAPNASEGLAFISVLLAGLRFVGAVGWMITEAPGWKWRMGVLVLHEVYTATLIGMFHDLILWCFSLLAIYVYLRRLSRFALVTGLFGLVLGVFILQDTKLTLRRSIWNERAEVVVFGRQVTFSDWSRPFVSGLCLMDSATKLVRGGFTDESIGNSVTRFNQGWIIDRVMTHMPKDEPFARGETLWAAARATLLPRFLAPDKVRIDGKMNMERFADHSLGGETTMNLGFAGEMYANFGLWGGAAGCGFYALALGLFFRGAATLSHRSALWWAFGLYSGHWALKAETDVAGVMNYIFKATLVLLAVTWLMPSIRAELNGERKTPKSRDHVPRGKWIGFRKRRMLERAAAASNPGTNPTAAGDAPETLGNAGA